MYIEQSVCIENGIRVQWILAPPLTLASTVPAASAHPNQFIEEKKLDSFGSTNTITDTMSMTE